MSCAPHYAQQPELTDTSCANLSETFLESMEGRSHADVVQGMGEPGADRGAFLRFIGGSARRGTYGGSVNFTFEDGMVSIIEADVYREMGEGQEGPRMQFIWNSHMAGCSDFPGSSTRCSDTGPEQ